MTAAARPPSSPAAAVHGRPGFTLLEVVLVMLLLCAMLAMAVPSLRGFAGGSRARDAATQIVAVAGYARARAAADARVYRLNIDPSNGQYRLTVQDGTEFVPLGSDFGQAFELPPGAQLRARPSGTANGGASNRGSASGGTAWIDFYPDGRSDALVLTLVDETGAEQYIAAPSPVEPYRVLPYEEAARL